MSACVKGGMRKKELTVWVSRGAWMIGGFFGGWVNDGRRFLRCMDE